MALKWRFQSFVKPGNSFQKFTSTNSKNIQTKYIELCLSAISFCGCSGVFVFQTIVLRLYIISTLVYSLLCNKNYIAKKNVGVISFEQSYITRHS